ncbi:MAG: dihydroorotase [Planctomycetes bacterium]|nr:dihydroorotase [Planctomycetota bacterium]
MSVVLDSPLDMHLHLREGEVLQAVAPLSAAHFAGAVIMPNLVSPVDSIERVKTYHQAIVDACGDAVFAPYMTLFFMPYSRADLLAVREHILGVKLYPAGATTQSDGGVVDLDRIGDTVALLEALEIPLLVHGESRGFVMDREREFLGVYQWLAENFPRLRIVMEHITTADAIEFLGRFSNVSATVTLHHLLITLDDVIGGLMKPDLFCKPIAKTPHDREALREAVFAGHDRIVFGSDSAPHPRHKKECCGCAAGVFSAPVALPMLAQLFDTEDHLELLPDFVSGFAQKIYGVTPPKKRVVLERQPWRVPALCSGVRPFMAGETLQWSVVES